MFAIVETQGIFGKSFMEELQNRNFFCNQPIYDDYQCVMLKNALEISYAKWEILAKTSNSNLKYIQIFFF